jgi:PAS domain S-box-containing protein
MSEDTNDPKAIDVRILVVDDQRANRLALRALLTEPDYRVVEAASAREALHRLLGEEFALILLDVVMPDMSGFELASAVKQRRQTAALPILFLTAEADDMDRVFEGYQLGAVDYLVKPLNPDVVRAKVAVFAELYRQRKRIERQAALLVEAERRSSELRLVKLRLAADRRYRTVAEAAPQIMWTASSDGRVDYFNRRWFEYTGWPDSAPPDTWADAIHPGDLDRCRRAWRTALDSGETLQIECRLRNAAGNHRWHLCRALPVDVEETGPPAWIGTFTDIDDQKRALLEREVLHRETAEALQARDEFLSVASHELKTPLSALKLQLQLLLERPPADAAATPGWTQAKRGLELANRQVDRLVRLVAALLDVSKINAGRLQLELAEVDLSAIAEEVVARLADEAARSKVAVNVRAAGSVVGRWDRLRLEQVVTNLLTNALKFGAGKPVDIEIAGRRGVASLTVRDRGMGIAPDDVERVFRRFEQTGPARAYGGLGLGLYIVRQIVEAHGGTIRVESRPSEGSTFFVELPREPSAMQIAPVIQAADGRAPHDPDHSP